MEEKVTNNAKLARRLPDKKELRQHLLESEEFREESYKGDLEKITDASEFRVRIPRKRTVAP